MSIELCQLNQFFSCPFKVVSPSAIISSTPPVPLPAFYSSTHAVLQLFFVKNWRYQPAWRAGTSLRSWGFAQWEHLLHALRGSHRTEAASGMVRCFSLLKDSFQISLLRDAEPGRLWSDDDNPSFALRINLNSICTSTRLIAVEESHAEKLSHLPSLSCKKLDGISGFNESDVVVDGSRALLPVGLGVSTSL